MLTRSARSASIGQDPVQAVEDVLGLGLDVALADQAAVLVHRQLASHEQQVPDRDRVQ